MIGRFLFAALLFMGLSARAQQADASWRDEKKWRVCLAPSFLKPEVSFQIPNAAKTVLVPASLSENGPQFFKKEQFDALKIEWEKFRAKSDENTADELTRLKPEYVRDRKKTIQYAALKSTVPGISGMVLSPRFRKTYEEIFGPRFLVIIPNEFAIYIFPRLASNYRDYAPMILEAFSGTAHPVSLEVFEVSADGLRAVGIFENP